MLVKKNFFESSTFLIFSLYLFLKGKLNKLFSDNLNLNGCCILFVNSSINSEVDQKWKNEINILRIGLLGGERPWLIFIMINGILLHL